MSEEVFYELYNYGFTQEEIDKIDNGNDFIYKSSPKSIDKIFEFLNNKGLTKKEIIKLVNSNPFMLTESKERLDYFDKIYKETLKFTQEELLELLKKNPECYTESPIEFEKIINYLMNKELPIENIKRIILNSPNIINQKLQDIINIIERGN